MCPSARRISLASHCIYTRVVAFTGHYVRQNVALLVGDKLFARKVDYLLGDVAIIHHLHVLLQQLFLMPVQSGHRSLEESCREASHVRYGAIDKELFDYGLLREYFAEPHRQLHIILEGFANDTYQVWDLSTNAGPERHRQRKCHDVLQNLVLIVGAGYASLSHDLQVDTPRRRVILIRLKAEAAEDLKKKYKNERKRRQEKEEARHKAELEAKDWSPKSGKKKQSWNTEVASWKLESGI